MKIDFSKTNNKLIPAIIQDDETKSVLMLGYMNKDSIDKTKKTKKVTFYSRSKKRLWTKGEESGNYLNFISMKIDCDNDTLLIKAKPDGPTCHEGFDTCWKENNYISYGFLSDLEKVIEDRYNDINNKKSYISSLFKEGINKIAQKVGEEAVETIIEVKNNEKERFLNESADLLFHLLILLKAKGVKFDDVISVLKSRN
ncbi:MAG: bifunctional phosphoribosyl-AMP cyclohydrolase/phosphoribosyl-ATP diphosphatase HisIE [Flavobacteriaceae bacterium]|tara:strand:- start:321 stop:917 length:597 start_codon:yes stop_codon:yes gene_type:complete